VVLDLQVNATRIVTQVLYGLDHNDVKITNNRCVSETLRKSDGKATSLYYPPFWTSLALAPRDTSIPPANEPSRTERLAINKSVAVSYK
jgi:hypothetical protein